MSLKDTMAADFAAIAGNADELAELCVYTPSAGEAVPDVGVLIWGDDDLATSTEGIGATTRIGAVQALIARQTLAAVEEGGTITRADGSVWTIDTVVGIGEHAWRLGLVAPDGAESFIPGMGGA